MLGGFDSYLFRQIFSSYAPCKRCSIEIEKEARIMNTLKDPKTAAELDRLFESARGDPLRFVRLIPHALKGITERKTLWEIMTPGAMKDVFIPIDREKGGLLYVLARSMAARRIVEFGTSFGISTIYLAAAIKDNDGIEVIGTEIEPSKREAACANLTAAGLADFVDIRLGDAMQTLETVDAPIDLLFMDGWKDLYLPVLEMLKPKLKPGALVVSDNIHTFKKTLKPYEDYLSSGDNGFESITLPLTSGFAVSVYTNGR